MEECKALSPLGPAHVFPLYYLFLLAQGKKKIFQVINLAKLETHVPNSALKCMLDRLLLEPVEDWIQTGVEFSFRYDGSHFSKASGIAPTLPQLSSGQVLLCNLFKDEDWNSYQSLI